MIRPLERLSVGMAIPFGGDRLAVVGRELAAEFQKGDRLLVIQETGELLRVPAALQALAAEAVEAALGAFEALKTASEEALSHFFDEASRALANEEVWEKIAKINAADLAAAAARGRPTGRLEASAAMRAAMIAGLKAWRDAPPLRGRLTRQIAHEGWSLCEETAPLGVIGFVFEARPNVVVDAAGVVKGGNAAVLRIGADALATAGAILDLALAPALLEAGLPAAVTLLKTPAHAAGWALFSDRRLSLAIARGSGPATALLGAIARQSGVPASLHGTGGAGLVADRSADLARFSAAVAASLDRKVCNTLNVCCIASERAGELTPAFLAALEQAGGEAGARLHVLKNATPFLPEAWRGKAEALALADLGREWEWESAPEVSLAIVEDLEEAIRLFNAHAPRLAASLIAEDPAAQARFFEGIEAPFVGDGMTRWVDGQFAYGLPELGLSNWAGGRLFSRSAALTGEDAFTIRARMRQIDPGLRR
ncbi:MAG: aldehyde dehydrogenase family protein [Caulobacteraceae bacterium]